MKRRTLIKAALGVGAAVGLGLGAGETLTYLIKRELHRKGKIKSEAELKNLEKLALETQAGLGFNTYNDSSSELLVYELSFKLALGNNFSYQSLLSKMKKNNFPYDKFLLVVDIGGAAGTAAKTLDEIPDVKAFVIDPSPRIPPSGKGLPKERFIIKKIEETRLPDNVFHFMTSFNTYQYTDLPKSFTEPRRLLKRGGLALIEVEDWSEPEKLKQINSLNMKEDIYVASQMLGQPEIMSFDMFYKVHKKVYEEMREKASGVLWLAVQPAFIIRKK